MGSWKDQVFRVEEELRRRADIAEMHCSEWKERAVEDAEAQIQTLERRVANMEAESIYKAHCVDGTNMERESRWASEQAALERQTVELEDRVRYFEEREGRLRAEL